MSIQLTAANKYEFPFHTIKGISTDDFHSNIEALMYEIFGTAEEKASKILTSHDFQQSFIRDIFSSCPSPVFSSNRSLCAMRFSPFAENCIKFR
jgi:hypothetical protein